MGTNFLFRNISISEYFYAYRRKWEDCKRRIFDNQITKFNEMKQAVMNIKMLHHPDMNKRFLSCRSWSPISDIIVNGIDTELVFPNLCIEYGTLSCGIFIFVTIWSFINLLAWWSRKKSILMFLGNYFLGRGY